MSYETRYAAKMMRRRDEYYASPEAKEIDRRSQLAANAAEQDLHGSFPDGINAENAAEILAFQRDAIRKRKAEFCV